MATKRNELKVTTIEEMKAGSAPQIVELPPFSQGHPFVAVLKRPSMFAMMRSGRIPNTLINEANKLFSSGPAAVVNNRIGDKNTMDELFSIIECICEDAFVEPTYKEIKEAGVELTDEQLMFVFAYSQQGVKSLEPFRIK